MQKLQLEQTVDSKTEVHNLNLENTSQITWSDIQGLTWLLEEDY